MKFEIYFPSKDKDGKDLEALKRFQSFHKIHETLIREFSGYTKIPAKGMYHGKDGKTVSEDIIIFLVYTSDMNKGNIKANIRELCQDLKNELHQASVMYTINNEVYFV